MASQNLKRVLAFIIIIIIIIMIYTLENQKTMERPAAQPMIITEKPNDIKIIDKKHSSSILEVSAISPIGQHSYSDRPDDDPGLYQIHILYVIPNGFNYSNRDIDGSINRHIDLLNEWFASQTDGLKIRFDTYQGELDITFVQLALYEEEMISYLEEQYSQYDKSHQGLIFLRNGLEDWLNKYNEKNQILYPGKLYLTYFEISESYVCGDGPTQSSRVIGLYPRAFNVRDQNDCKAFLGYDQEHKRGIWEQLIVHEIIHALGFPNKCSPNIDEDGVHISDPTTPNDIMGAQLGIYDPTPVLDPNHNDYYHLIDKNCPNLSESPFLDPLPENPKLPKNVLSNFEWRLP